MPSEKYTINVSGEVFCFTKDQLQSEPGNYFASYFFGGFQEATNGTKELQLEKEPMIFRHIQTHLRGYKIFPIPVGFMPPYMDEMTALQNLQSDADFFGLERLRGLAGEEIQRKASKPPKESIEPLRYRIWDHSFHRDATFYGQLVSDGASVEARSYTPISKEGVALFRSKNGDPHYNCRDCFKVTEGWDFVVAISIATKPNNPTHYVVECR